MSSRVLNVNINPYPVASVFNMKYLFAKRIFMFLAPSYCIFFIFMYKSCVIAVAGLLVVGIKGRIISPLLKVLLSKLSEVRAVIKWRRFYFTCHLLSLSRPVYLTFLTITNRLFKTALTHGNILDELQTDDYYFCSFWVFSAILLHTMVWEYKRYPKVSSGGKTHCMLIISLNTLQVKDKSEAAHCA